MEKPRPGNDVTEEEQLERWLLGESVHNRNGACVPDFSCCGEPLAPEKLRRFYVETWYKTDDLNRNFLDCNFEP